MNLDHINVLQLQLQGAQDFVRGVGGSQQQLLERIRGHIRPSSDVGLGLVAELQGLLLGHDEGGGGTVREERRVRRCVRAVRLDEGGGQLGHLVVSAVSLNTILHTRAVHGDDFTVIQSYTRTDTHTRERQRSRGDGQSQRPQQRPVPH